MRAMVTGATGFTGGHLARALRERGVEVRALVRDEHRADGLRSLGVEIVPGDLADAASVRRATQGCDVVYHVAALYREARHPDDIYRRVNVEGTRNVLEAAAAAGVRRLVHCSTVGVHGDVDAPADEDAPFAPGDVYQRTKLEGELLVRDYARRGLPATVFRPVGIYGPGDLRFLKLFRTIRDGTFRMIGDGSVLYHMTFIDDLVAGILLCGERPEAVGRTYILAGPRYTTLTELAQAIGAAVGRAPSRRHVPFGPMLAAARACEAICRPLGIEPPLHRRRLDFFAKDRGFSTARARADLGYEPHVDLDEGAARTVAWYRSAGHL